ncbi:hypothetical protein C8R44DRAFT_865982 [Mycena epipterygia]|nr:hypothetical protein C8R44DRAFT_865982 [Mycena epipterygia]
MREPSSQADLEAVKKDILGAAPHASIATFVADVVDTQAAKAVVAGTIAAFGRLDVAIENAGKADPWKKPFTEYNPDNWWKTMEVNIRGFLMVPPKHSKVDDLLWSTLE